VLGKNKKKLLSEYIPTLFENGNEFKKRVLATYENNTYAENFQCHILPRDGIRERWLEHWSHPILQGPPRRRENRAILRHHPPENGPAGTGDVQDQRGIVAIQRMFQNNKHSIWCITN